MSYSYLNSFVVQKYINNAGCNERYNIPQRIKVLYKLNLCVHFESFYSIKKNTPNLMDKLKPLDYIKFFSHTEFGQKEDFFITILTPADALSRLLFTRLNDIQSDA